MSSKGRPGAEKKRATALVGDGELAMGLKSRCFEKCGEKALHVKRIFAFTGKGRGKRE
jgi:hypothetical protein